MIRCLGKGHWTPLTNASNCTSTWRTDRCDIGERSSERRTRIFKQSQDSSATRLLRWSFPRTGGQRTLLFPICWCPKKGSVMDFDAYINTTNDHVNVVPGRCLSPYSISLCAYLMGQVRDCMRITYRKPAPGSVLQLCTQHRGSGGRDERLRSHQQESRYVQKVFFFSTSAIIPTSEVGTNEDSRPLSLFLVTFFGI